MTSPTVDSLSDRAGRARLQISSPRLSVTTALDHDTGRAFQAATLCSTPQCSSAASGWVVEIEELTAEHDGRLAGRLVQEG